MEELDHLSENQKKSENILNEIKGILNSARDTELEIDELLKYAKEKKRSHTREINTLSKFNDKADKELNVCKQNLDDSKNQLSEINNFYEKQFNAIVEKVKERRSALTAENQEMRKAQTQQNTILKNLKKTNVSFDSQLSTLKKELIANQKLLKEIKSQAKIISGYASQSGLNLANIKKRNEEIGIIHNQIKTFKTESSSLKNSIDKNFNESEKKLLSINKNKTDSDEIYKKILAVYDLSSKAALSGEFKNRRVAFEKSMKRYEIILYSITALLLGCIIFLFYFQIEILNEGLKNPLFYIRFLMFSPIVYLIHFVSLQYSSNKKQYEKYAFKASLSMSIDDHIETLASNPNFQEPDSKRKILDFIISGFQRIYTEPFSDDDLKLKIKLSSLEMKIEKRILNEMKKIAPIVEKTETNK